MVMRKLNQFLLLCMVAPGFVVSTMAQTKEDDFKNLRGPLERIEYDWPTKIFIDHRGRISGKPARIESAYAQPYIPGEHLLSPRDWDKGLPMRYVVVFENWDLIREGAKDGSGRHAIFNTARPRFFTFTDLEPKLVPLFDYTLKTFHENKRGNPRNVYQGKFVDRYFGYGDISTDDGKLHLWNPELGQLGDRYPGRAELIFRNLIKDGALNPASLDALEKQMKELGAKLHPGFRSAALGPMNQFIPFMSCFSAVRTLSKSDIPQPPRKHFEDEGLLDGFSTP